MYLSTDPPVLPDPDYVRTLIPGITEGGAVIIGLIILAGMILFFFGRVLAKRLEATLSEVRKQSIATEVVRDQIENNHVDDPDKVSNVRDDLDQKHSVTVEKLDLILATQKEHNGAIIGIRKDLRQLRDVDLSNSDDIRSLRDRLDQHLSPKTAETPKVVSHASDS